MSLDFLPEGPVREIARREVERADIRMRALIVAGSHARGEATAGSDLDLYSILRDGEGEAFSATFEDGVFVERTRMDEAAARAKIARNPMAWATFREGRALVDDGVLSELRRAAEEAAIAWRPDPAGVAGCAHWLRSSVVKIEAALAAGDEAKAAWTASTTTFELARGIFFANGRPVPAAGAAWSELRRLPERPDLATLDAILLGATSRARSEGFVAAARWTIARL